jgi:hypothetical protein
MASVVVQTVGLLKSHVLDLDSELLREDYQCETDVEQEVLIYDAFDAPQQFMSAYDFLVINDQGSPSDQP